MQIKKIRLLNYRAHADSAMSFSELTAIVGGNNAGKSAFITAIELFFDPLPKLSEVDFHNRNIDEKITISLTFENFVEEENKLFQDKIKGGLLTLARDLFFDGRAESGLYYVEGLANPDFQPIRDETAATPQRAAYNKIRKEAGYESLPSVTKAADIDPLLREWEAQNPDALELMKIDAFRGFPGKATNHLKRRTDLVVVPAVRDAKQEVDGARKSPTKDLISAIGKQVLSNNKRYKEFIDRSTKEISELTDPSKVSELGQISDDLNDLLKDYYPESSLKATWQPVTQLPELLPEPLLLVNDNAFSADVGRVGHGLQRAIILTILRYMARGPIVGLRDEGDENTPPSDDPRYDSAQSDIIIAIEEPELYQHPIKQRQFYHSLHEIAGSVSEATGIRLQIVYTTHSQIMLQTSHFDKIRLVRRSENQKIEVSESSLTTCSRRCAVLSGRSEEDAFEDHVFAAKLHIFRPSVAEGFFAQKVVLTEGISDWAIMEAVFADSGMPAMANGICVVSVGGKTNLDRPAVIFQAFNVPTFVIFDNDINKGKKKQNINYNKIFQRWGGVAEGALVDFPSGVTANYASLGGDLENHLREAAGDKLYDEVRNHVQTLYNVDADSCVKSPKIAAQMYKMMKARGATFHGLEEIRDRVLAL